MIRLFFDLYVVGCAEAANPGTRHPVKAVGCTYVGVPRSPAPRTPFATPLQDTTNHRDIFLSFPYLVTCSTVTTAVPYTGRSCMSFVYMPLTSLYIHSRSKSLPSGQVSLQFRFSSFCIPLFISLAHWICSARASSITITLSPAPVSVFVLRK